MNCDDLRISEIRPHSKGNVLFLILIAVALFAALSYAVTSTSRSGESTLSRDKAKIIASEVIQYAASLEQAVARIMIINGYGVEYLDVDDSSGYVVQNANTNCSSNKCKLFHPEGGQAIPKLLPANATNLNATSWFKVENRSRLFFMIVPVKDVGSDAADLVMLYGAVKQEVCDEINIKMGIHARGDSRPLDGHDAFAIQQGNLIPYPQPAGMLGEEDARIAGKRSFCITKADLWGNYFYHVLVAR